MLPEDLPTALWVLLGLMAFVLILIWIGQMRMRARLARIESLLRKAAPADPAAELKEQKAANSEQKRLFQEFLDEDPARSELPKKEQFAAFREWRSERGLNWGKGDS